MARATKTAASDLVKDNAVILTGTKRPFCPVAFTQIPLCLLADPAITGNDKAVFGVISFLAWKHGECQEPLTVIASMAGISERKARRAVAALIQSSYLSRKRRPRPLTDVLTPRFDGMLANAVTPETKPRPKLILCACGRKCVAAPCRDCRLGKRIEVTAVKVLQRELDERAS